MITPLKAGLTEIKVTANSPKTQDIVVKHLQVEVISVPLNPNLSKINLFCSWEEKLNTTPNPY